MIPAPSPGVLRESAVAAIVGALHTAHNAGPWALVRLEQVPPGVAPIGSRLVFAAGYARDILDDGTDGRPRIVVTVVEER